jgi:hypothetical protein
MDLVSVLVVLVATLLASFGFLYAYGMAHLQEIKENWVSYRCNPIYMPMAGAVGSDIGKNFMFCTMQSVNKYAGFIMDPIYKNFAILTGIINSILDSINSLRQYVTGAADGFLGIIRNTFGKIQNTFGTTIQMVNRVRTLMNRMVGVFAVIMNIVSTGIYTGESVSNGPIGDAARFLCFRSSTPVMTDHGYMPIVCVEPGMRLSDGQLVKSTMRFDGRATPMCQLGKAVVSANHKVLYNGNWIRVEDHPHAIPAESYGTLVCLNTENHTIPIGQTLFMDYEETDNPRILSEFFRRVETYYGTAHSPEKTKNPLKYRYTGVTPGTHVITDTGSLRRAADISIGDYIRYGDRVIGILYHDVDRISTYRGVTFATGTWVRTQRGVEPLLKGTSTDNKTRCIQFLTEKGCLGVYSDRGETLILDDHEVPSDEIHDWRDNEVQKEPIVV